MFDEKRKEYYIKNRDKRLLWQKEWKLNNKERVKELNKKSREKPEIKEKNKQYNKEYNNRPEVKKHRNEYIREYRKRLYVQLKEDEYRNRPEVKKLISKSRKKCVEKKGREAIIAYKRKYRQENKERVLLVDKEYRKKNKEKLNVRAQNRRALKKSLINDFTVEQWNNCLKYFDYKCAYCGKPTDKMTQEHFIPLKKNGGTTVKNMLPVCEHCNASKLKHNFEDWYTRQDFCTIEGLIKINTYFDEAA